MEKKSNSVLKIAVVVMAIIILALAGVVTAFVLKPDSKTEVAENSSSVSDSVAEVPETDAATEEATQAPTEPPTEEPTTVETTVHVSSKETVNFSMGSEKGEINKVLDYDSNKLYSTPLSDFIPAENNKIDSFVFVFYAEDGSSNIRSFKGACGISVDDSCDAATDEGWYRSEDFQMDVNSSYLEVKWDVPSEIRDYINISDGNIQIGYWWGGVQRLRLESIICNYTNSTEILVDGTKTIEPDKTLRHDSESEKQVNIPLSELVEDGQTPQYFEFKIQGGGELQKYAGAFGISVDDSCDAATDDNWYQSGNVAVMTSSDNATLYWLVPDEIKSHINNDGDVMLGYWWSKQDSVTLESVTVKYCLGSGETVSANADVSDDNKQDKKDEDSDDEEDAPQSGEKSSAEIVKDIKIGWNLGNTLDCYDVTWDVDEFETAWGNPKTTKSMIDTVKKAGFNAVRVPVTWNEHMDGNTIDKAWLDRVNEVVDYAIDNDMYVILNVHHDDYTWLNPTKADEAKVKERLVKIWEQLSERFKDYDYHLIFEGMNEPRIIGGKDEWTCGTAEEREVINNLFAAFVETVRKSGGNNKTRSLIITAHAAAMDETGIKDVKIPDDDRIIVSIHYYSPWDFAGGEDSRSDWGSDSDKKELDKGFDLVKKYFIDKGVPVIIGEFGSVNKNNEDVRKKHMEYYVKSAKQRGIKCFVWDNGKKEEFGLLNRSDNSWYFKSIVDAGVNAAK